MSVCIHVRRRRDIWSLPGPLQRLWPGKHWWDKVEPEDPTSWTQTNCKTRWWQEWYCCTYEEVWPPHWLRKCPCGMSDPQLLEEDCRSHPHLAGKSYHEFGLWTSAPNSMKPHTWQTAVPSSSITVSRPSFHLVFFTNFPATLTFCHDVISFCSVFIGLLSSSPTLSLADEGLQGRNVPNLYPSCSVFCSFNWLLFMHWCNNEPLQDQITLHVPYTDEASKNLKLFQMKLWIVSQHFVPALAEFIRKSRRDQSSIGTCDKLCLGILYAVYDDAI